MKSKVLFTKEISTSGLVKIYEALGEKLNGKVAVKLHSGEEGNQNYLRPEFVRELIHHVNGTVVECNTAYNGARNTTEKHKVLMEKHGWNKYFDVDIMDAEGDLELDIPNGKVIKKNYIGKNISNYDSMLVLSHFKGHPMGGYGGALKQLSIGVASSSGKTYIHTAGKTAKQEELWDNAAEQNLFLESMADAASSVVNYFNGNIIYINVLCNMSVDCDCCAVAEDPCLKNIGIIASLDPVAIDEASINLVKNSNDPGKVHFMERVNSRNGLHTIEEAEKHGIGSREYELVNID